MLAPAWGHATHVPWPRRRGVAGPSPGARRCARSERRVPVPPSSASTDVMLAGEKATLDRLSTDELVAALARLGEHAAPREQRAAAPGREKMVATAAPRCGSTADAAAHTTAAHALTHPPNTISCPRQASPRRPVRPARSSSPASPRAASRSARASCACRCASPSRAAAARAAT